MPSERLRIVVGDAGTLGDYPDGGGHWSVALQYLLGFRALGHEVFLLELVGLPEGSARRELAGRFFERLAPYELDRDAALLVHPPERWPPTLADCEAFGPDVAAVQRMAEEADLLVNFAGSVQQPVLSCFRRKAFLDIDPGIVQVSAADEQWSFFDHDVFLTVASKIGDADCRVPTLGVEWHRFHPFVHLPMWEAAPDPGPDAPFSSVAHWNWNEFGMEWDGMVLDSSKRHAYLRYVALPAVTRRPFELATNLTPADDSVGDAEVLAGAGWRVVDAWAVAASPADYRAYIAASRAEVMCPKPLYRQLRTGWFSDRSVCYLASGRPVLAEDTGYGDHLPVGEGIVPFHDLATAAAGVADIDDRYETHSRAARELAEAHFDARRCLRQILDACA